jgi:hypothetical protein
MQNKQILLNCIKFKCGKYGGVKGAGFRSEPTGQCFPFPSCSRCPISSAVTSPHWLKADVAEQWLYVGCTLICWLGIWPKIIVWYKCKCVLRQSEPLILIKTNLERNPSLCSSRVVIKLRTLFHELHGGNTSCGTDRGSPRGCSFKRKWVINENYKRTKNGRRMRETDRKYMLKAWVKQQLYS